MIVLFPDHRNKNLMLPGTALLQRFGVRCEFFRGAIANLNQSTTARRDKDRTTTRKTSLPLTSRNRAAMGGLIRATGFKPKTCRVRQRKTRTGVTSNDRNLRLGYLMSRNRRKEHYRGRCPGHAGILGEFSLQFIRALNILGFLIAKVSLTAGTAP